MAEASTVQNETPRKPTRSLRSLFGSLGSLLRTTEVDTRLLGLIVALVVIWIGFNIMSGGLFLTSRNLWNLSVQSASVAIMATGMVLVIVSRNIDLSVGSVLTFTGMTMAMIQTDWLPNLLGVGVNQPYTWIVALAIGLLLGALIGGLQGFIIAYLGVPSFIVTLGGLLIWAGFAFEEASGRTISPLDSTFQLLGGGPIGSIGETASWVVGIIACIGIVYTLTTSRRRRRRYGFPVRPMWAEATLLIVGIVAVLGAVWVANSYLWPEALAQQYGKGPNTPVGIAIPVLLAIVVAFVMTILATRRRFGRYVFAIGGNPEAAELGGINTRRMIMLTFVIMGTLAAVSAAILSARLNAAVVGLGAQAELYVIAAAVIGGTSFAGGIGTIAGAVLGAVVMQSLQSGMVLLRVDSPIQDIVVGIVLVAAVGTDAALRRRAS
jgi:ABC-type xylose transport system, permease component